MATTKTPVFWALVADSGFARVLQLERSPQRISERKALESPSRRLVNRELVSDASGRDRHARGLVGHTITPPADAHDKGEEAFVAELVDYLEAASRTGDFDKLAIVADPRTLGRVRQCMSKPLAAKVMVESDHDLTRLTVPLLESRLRALLGWPDQPRATVAH